MSDGPFKSPNLPARWSRVAKYVDMEASSSDEVAQRLPSPLARDFEEISSKLFTSLRQALGDDDQTPLGLDEPERFEAIRPRADSGPLGSILIDHAIVVASEGLHGYEAFREIMRRTLIEHLQHRAGELEETCCRGVNDRHLFYIRETLSVAANSFANSHDLVRLIDQILGKEAKPTRHSEPKLIGIDDGPRF
jgi:hypothetical protein